MAIMCIFRVKHATPEDYDEIRRRVGWEEDPPAGGIAHFLTFTKDGAVEYDVWENRRTFEAFHNGRMKPVLRDVDVDMGEPQIIELDGLAIAQNVQAYQLPRAAPRTIARARVLESDARA